MYTAVFLLYMTLNCGKTLRADHVFHPAGICGSCLRGNPQTDQPAGQELVAFINFFCNRASRFGEGDMPLFVHDDVTAGAQIFHGHTDAGFGKSQFRGDIDGAHLGMTLAKNQNCLQIVFCGFLYFQSKNLLVIDNIHYRVAYHGLKKSSNRC